MKKGKEIELTVEKFADRGKSLARVDGFVVFIPQAVPGDRVRVRIRRKKKSFAEAVLLEVIEPSELRTTPRCEYFGTCGGCKWQHVDYAAQLEAKRQSVKDALEHTGGFSGIDVPPTHGAEDIFRYRNKMEYSFSASRWLTTEEIASGKSFNTEFALGMHVPGRFDRVIDLHSCFLPASISMDIVNGMRTLALEEGWSCWSTSTRSGFLRHLVVRTGARTGEVMVNLVTNGFDDERFEKIKHYLKESFPSITTFVNTSHTGVAQVAIGEKEYIGFGSGVIHDEIGGFRFEIAPSAFFQTNTVQAERLYEFVREFSEARPDDLLYDLYCGAGTISLFMARYVKHVVGIELVPEAVKNAYANAAANNVENCTFAQGDMKNLFDAEFVARHGKPDVFIVDPPRAGMHEKVVKEIADLKPERFVYVSCNPQTQARDIKLLADLYLLEQIQPVDLFPHTTHIENVIKMRLRSDV